jgi:hypothetical protein
MQIIQMITRPDGSLHLAVKIENVEYINPLADWVCLAEQIIEESETHLTPVAADAATPFETEVLAHLEAALNILRAQPTPRR